MPLDGPLSPQEHVVLAALHVDLQHVQAPELQGIIQAQHGDLATSTGS